MVIKKVHNASHSGLTTLKDKLGCTCFLAACSTIQMLPCVNPSFRNRTSSKQYRSTDSGLSCGTVKLQEFNALQSPEGFQNFMNWLVRWRLSDIQPGTDLLKCIPDECRKMRADFPAMDESGIKMADDEGWDG